MHHSCCGPSAIAGAGRPWGGRRREATASTISRGAWTSVAMRRFSNLCQGNSCDQGNRCNYTNGGTSVGALRRLLVGRGWEWESSEMIVPAAALPGMGRHPLHRRSSGPPISNSSRRFESLMPSGMTTYPMPKRRRVSRSPRCAITAFLSNRQKITFLKKF
jgi:hypothetical protein